jgi:hypothetical protein
LATSSISGVLDLNKSPEAAPSSQLAISSLTNLTPLLRRVSVIEVTNLFHLFDEAKQAELAKRIAALISPTQGSIIFAINGGSSPAGNWFEHRWFHSPGTFEDLWRDVPGKDTKLDLRFVLGTGGSHSMGMRVF